MHIQRETRRQTFDNLQLLFSDINFFSNTNQYSEKSQFNIRFDGVTVIVFLPQYELKEMTIPEYFRTQEEFTKPFMSDESPVRKAGLKLVSMEKKDFPLPEKKLLLETGDAKIAARSLTEQTRAWSNSMFLSSKSNGKLDTKSVLVLKSSRPELKLVDAKKTSSNIIVCNMQWRIGSSRGARWAPHVPRPSHPLFCVKREKKLQKKE